MSQPTDGALMLREELQKLQGGRCGICGLKDGRLRLDHDHDSGFVRGLLCNTCNLAEGRHGATCEIPQDCGICIWRATPAVAWLGVTVRHSMPAVIDELHREWVPAETVVATYESCRQRILQVIDEKLGRKPGVTLENVA